MKVAETNTNETQDLLAGTAPVAPRRPRGRPKTLDDAARRAQILEGARALFFELGYARTTTDLVAARCRISKNTLYRLFQSKSDMFIAMVVAHRQTMLALPRAGDDVDLAKAIGEIFRIDISAEQEVERTAFMQFAVQEFQNSPEMAEHVNRHGFVESQAMLADWLARQRHMGRITLADPHSGARMLMDMIFGAMMFRPGAGADWPDRDARQVHIRQCIAVFLNGIRPRQD